MICKIYDGKFDAKYLHDIFEVLEDKINYKANNVANASTWPYFKTGTHKLLGSTIFSRKHLNFMDYVDNENALTFYRMFDFLCEILERDSRSVFLERIAINLQHSGCDGTLHIDSEGPQDKGSYTLMVMPNPIWEKGWGGKFQIFSEDRSKMLEEHDYVPGRVILFPSHLPHRGLASTKKYIYRYSIVYGVRF